MVAFIRSDLQFILDQIIIAERQAAGEDLRDILPNVQVPWGLRTVSGELNNLVTDQGQFGAADNIFPRLTDQTFRVAEGVPAGFFGPGSPGIPSTSYSQTTGPVIDSQPRVISNLIVDQTPNNPAAAAAAAANGGAELIMSPGLDGLLGTADDRPVYFIPNITPNAGLSAPFNAWMTFFGQFFDHGLDLVTKGGNDTIYIPLKADDPLIAGADGIFGNADDLAPSLRFMAVTRATQFDGPGADGILGTADDTHHETQNTTSPFVDQNQTYSSHPSHQAFLRAYEIGADGQPHATGKLIENRDLGDGIFGNADDTPIGGMATWAVLKAQARDILGIELTDADVFNVPLLATDAYGNFIKGEHGFPQLVVGLGADNILGTDDDQLVEGNPAAPVNPTAVGALRTGHQFLIDIAHSASPVDDFGNPLTADADDVINTGPQPAGTYDDELLDAHYMAGDGRVNENIGLTAVHAVFHSEHNRLVDHTKQVLLAPPSATDAAAALTLLNAYLDPAHQVTTFPITPADQSALVWDGERLFQAAKFGTEMQYQHLVFEEFARTVQPMVDEFLAPNGYDTTIDPSIVAEFAHTVYRFGHSMLTEQFDRLDPNFNSSEIGLIAAFLNPLAYAASGPTPEEATGAIVRGLTRQVGNEIDEFVTEAVRNNLLGLPLDLPAINITRGRDTGIPTLNDARAQFFAMTGDGQLKPYISWADLAANLKHPESLINFIAAYGTHSSITGALTLDAKRAAAVLLVLGGAGEPADRLDFLNSTGAWASNLAIDPLRPKDLDGVSTTGLGNIDLWIGGLAEKQMPFGGLLGSTFNFVFETQLESLQNGDRFYYLSRTAGMNFAAELEQNSFSKLVMLNSDVTHLPDAIFSTPAFTLEVNQARQFTGLNDLTHTGNADPTGGLTVLGVEIAPLVIRTNPVTVDNPFTAFNEATANYLHYTGADHVVLGGTAGDDIIISSEGDDTLYGDEGNDRLEGGFGNDVILGGAGDDILEDRGGDDNLQGGDGNDVIHAGNMEAAGLGNLILGGAGQDFIMTVEDVSTTFGGQGNDFIYSAKTSLPPTGNEGDDWIELGTQDGAPGDNFAPFLADNVIGNDVFIGGGGFDEMIGEGGDDIFVGSDAQDKMDGMSGFDWITYKNDGFGVTADLGLAIFGGVGEIGDHIALPFAASPSSILDRFAEVEGLSGTAFIDILRGDDVDALTIINHGGATGGALTNLDLIDGLRDLLVEAGLPTTGAPASGFVAGNILLGGGGGDFLEGRGGDDLIDGDKWLNVRISIRDPNNHDIEWATTDGMLGQVVVTNPAAPPQISGHLHMLMLNGVVNPGQLQAVREILQDADGYDTAVFGGPRANYTITINGNQVLGDGPFDLPQDAIVKVTDNVGTDGTDTLVSIERLQFADTFIRIQAGNAEPNGQPVISDPTPTEGQLLTVSAASITDPDNVSVTNPTGAVTSQVAFTWQVERNPGSGVFEDIINLPAGDLAFQSANGTSFRVTPEFSGLSLRVKAVFVDAAGVPEIVFSAATAPVIDVPDAPPAPVVVPKETTEGGEGIKLARSDLTFILDQIRIAEAHAAGADLLSLVPNIRSAAGLRTVSGEFNNLLHLGGVDQTQFGAADNLFPHVTTPVFNGAENVTIDLDGPGPLTVGSPTSYTQTSGFVFDSQPRVISNLVVDQTANNPAAYANAYDVGANGHLDFGVTGPANDDVLKDGVSIVASPGLDGEFGTADDRDVFFFANVTPDAGLSAPFNAWMTFFGQFFDHGLDLVTKGGNGTIFIPLKADDPLIAGADGVFGNADDLAPGLRFMVLTRATQFDGPGADGVLGTPDDTHHETQNTTSPFVDQNQTYSSHPSHQVFLREYVLDDAGHPRATGRLITNHVINPDGTLGAEIGGMATWAVVKAQAAQMLGINLTDANVFNVPLLATDEYGNFIPDAATGMPQVVTTGGLVSGNLAAPISLATAVGTNHQFLIDIAHAADPSAAQPPAPPLVRFSDGDPSNGPTPAGTYDGDLLDAHYMAGDGRVNENIGLTAVHAIFHSEHNRLVDQVQHTLIETAVTVADINDWLLAPLPADTVIPTDAAAIDAFIASLDWNGERLFQAAKFGTEMQYQHLVFEEFARTIQPNVDAFFAPTQVYDVNLDASIVAEFAHTVYRFGHSMLTETVDRFDANFNPIDTDGNAATVDPQLGLIAAFLNPLAYAASGVTPEDATSAIVRGVTRTVGNEIDEFVTEALRNNLLGLPLDLPAINLARGRDVGIPSLNEVRRQVYEQTGETLLKPYTSWADFVQHIKHPESVINFIAAYGTHSTITSALTTADKRAAAMAIVLGTAGAPADRLDFLNATGAYAGGSLGGLNNIDLWIGGLAEEIMPFGGMLGSTFNFIFENQLEKLQDGDRFYYLERTAGLAFNAELEGNSFAKLIMANTSAVHLPALVFTTPTWTLEVDKSKQFTGEGISLREDPTGDNPLVPLVIRTNPISADNPDTPFFNEANPNYLRYTGEDHIVLGGTAGDDVLIASIGDDTIWGDAGNDRIDGGEGNDQLRGGAGDDIITDLGGDDNIQGGDGNDVIHGGNGINLIIGGFGSDFIVTGEDANESFGGQGNDFIFGTKADEQNMGGEGDDWLEHGTSDGAPGDNFDPLGNDPIAGNDVYIGSGENDKFNAEGGDDIMVGSPGTGDRYIGASGFDWATFKDDTLGVTIDLTDRFFDQPLVPGSGASILARFDAVEGLSGSGFADVLQGDNEDAGSIPTNGAQGSTLTNIALINGLQEFLDTLLAGALDSAAPLPAGVFANADRTHVTAFSAGNIILGGDGGDIIEGRAGDDLIDGDAWLNVRIGVYAADDVNHQGPTIASFDSMEPLIPLMVGGVYNPGQLQIIREIKQAAGPDFDTAKFSGPLIDAGADGVLGTADDAQRYTIAVDGQVVTNLNSLGSVGGESIVTVTDTLGTDGTDTLRHIERLAFSDQSIVLGGLNHAPRSATNPGQPGVLTITGSPVEDQTITASIANVRDDDNPNGGVIPGPVAYFWQVETVPGSGVFEDILTDFTAGEVARVSGPSFSLGDGEVGLRIRARAVYKDANGVLEEVFSAPQTVGNINDLPTAGPTISSLTPTEGLALTADPLTIVDADGTATAVAGGLFTFQWREAITTGLGGGLTPADFRDIAGATTQLFTPQQAQVNRKLVVVVTYTDDNGTIEVVTSAPTTVVGNQINGNGTAQTFNGTTPNADGSAGPNTTTEGWDIISGAGGADTIVSLGGNDIIDGGTGNDNIDAGAGDDTVNYTMGQGSDTVNGGADTDTLNIIGVAGNDTLDVVFDGTALTSVEGGAVSNVERVTADLSTGTNTLNYGATSVPLTVNLAIGAASGFLSVANIQNVTGGTGNDLITGDANANALNGGGGNDTLTGGLGSDALTGGAGDDVFVATDGDGDDTYNGGAGVDTYDLSGTSAAASITTTSASSAVTGNDTLTSIENFIGSQAADSIAVNGGNNVIDGQGGDDIISAGGGNDTVSGGSGDDTINGEIGNDILNGGIGADHLLGDAGTDTLNGDEGNDTLDGGAAADTLNGGTGDDTLIGGLANDVMTGGAGNDIFTYLFGDGADTIDGGADTDTLNITGTAAANQLDVILSGGSLTQFEGGTLTGIERVNADLLGGVDVLTYAGTTAANSVNVNLAAHTASGFLSVTGIENVVGGAGNDQLIGDGNANNLNGGAGNDTLDGGTGADTLVGGAGDDTYITDGGDTLTEAANAGTDTVQSSVAFTLANNFENLTLTGTAAINGTGNGANNIITGNSGANTLTGGAGVDTLLGGAGADRLVGGTGNDILTGGLDDDTFVFANVNESGVGIGNNDVITDFQGAGPAVGDVIDLSAIDAITGGADQAFTLLTTLGANFTAAGQLRIVQLGGDTFIQANTNANTGTIEFELRLTGLHNLTAADFVL